MNYDDRAILLLLTNYHRKFFAKNEVSEPGEKV